MRRRTPAIERLLARIDINERGCWVFSPPARNGYGYIGVTNEDGSKRNVLTHRLAYETIVGPIPVGLEIDHLCRNRACCNPDHLEPVTRSVNTLRGDSPALARQRRLSRTHCKNGHPFEGDNLRLTPKGVRMCVTCRREKGREHDRRRAGRRRRKAAS